MSADNRKVSTDALETLGTIIGPDEKRDAIHLAVVPMKAEWTVSPGERVDAKGNPHTNTPVGIVDPFLTKDVSPGQWFWLVIFPRQITSLRHVWSHPAFPDESVALDGFQYASEKSEEWLRDWLNRSDNGRLTYEGLLNLGRTGSSSENDNSDEYGNSWRIDGEYVFVYGSDASGRIPSEVWDHVENVIGRKVYGRPEYFSCSC